MPDTEFADAGSALEQPVSSPAVETPSAPATTPESTDAFADMARELGLTPDGQPLTESTPPEDESGEEQDEGDEDDGEEEELLPPAAESQSATPQTAEQWAPLIYQNRARINEVPAKIRSQVIDEVLATERRAWQQAADAAYQRGVQEAQQRAEQQAFVARIDAILDENSETYDPEQFAKWQRDYPDSAATYFAIKRGQQTGPGSPRAAAQQIVQASTGILQQLQANPEALAAVQAKQQAEPGRYAATPEGLARLAQDAAEAIAEARVAGQAKAEAPARKAAQQRQDAAQARGGLPRPPAGDGSSAAGALTFDSVKAMSDAEVEALMATPEGAKRVMDAVATAPR